jgi:hypothetical protein
MMQRGVKSRRCILQRGVESPRCIMHWGVKSHRSIYSGQSISQRGVKSKNFGRLPRPLKGQSCKINHIRGTFSILVLWESCIKTLPTYNLFLIPHCIIPRAEGSQTSNSNNSMNLKLKTKRF